MNDYTKEYSQRRLQGPGAGIPRTPGEVMGHFDAEEDERRRFAVSENDAVTQAAKVYFNQPLTDKQRIRCKGYKTIMTGLVLQSLSIVAAAVALPMTVFIILGGLVIVIGVAQVLRSFFHDGDKAV